MALFSIFNDPKIVLVAMLATTVAIHGKANAQIAVPDDESGLLDPIQSNFPWFCNQSPEQWERKYHRVDSSKALHIAPVGTLNDKWDYYVRESQRPNAEGELDKITSELVLKEIKLGCTGPALRQKLINISNPQWFGNKYEPPAQCFGDPDMVRKLQELSRALESRDALMSAVSLCESRNRYPDQCLRLSLILDFLEFTSSNRCESFYRKVVYRDFVQQLEARELRKEESRLAERRRLEKRQAEQRARQSAEVRERNLREETFASSGIDDQYQVVWGGQAEQSPTLSRPSEQALLNEINRLFQQQMMPGEDGTQFSPPPKGEFEKSSDYELRIQMLAKEHKASLESRRSDLQENRARVFEKVWNENLGTPVLHSLRYDADKEAFLANIHSNAGFALPVMIPIPIADAKSKKASLATMRPWVLLSLNANKLTPHMVILQGGGGLIEAHRVSDNLDFVFSSSQLATHRKAKATRQREEEENRQAQRAEKAKRYPYIATFQCSVNGGELPFSACLRSDGRLEIQTTEGVEVLTLRDFRGASSHVVDLTSSFLAGAQVGSGSRFGTIEIIVVDRITYNTLGSTVAVGAGDYAFITN